VAILGLIDVSLASAIRVPFVATFTKDIFALITTAAFPCAFIAAAKAKSARVNNAPP